MTSATSSDVPTRPTDPQPEGSPPAPGESPPSRRRSGRERRPLTLALLFSLLAHTLLLSLSFGGQGLGFPGLTLPWQDRRGAVPELRVVLGPARFGSAEPAPAPVAEPLQSALALAQAEQRTASGTAATPSARLTPTAGPAAAAIVTDGDSGRDAATGTVGTADATPVKPATPAAPPSRAESHRDPAPPPSAEPMVMPVARSGESSWVAPAAAPMPPTPTIAAPPSASSPASTAPLLQEPIDDAARARIGQGELDALQRALELATLERAMQAAQTQAEQLEAARQEAARLDAARADSARLEAERQQVARQDEARQAAARQEAAARQDAARADSARLEAERQQAARQAAAGEEAARQEAARPAGARQDSARGDAAQEAEARREATLRAIGRQLDEEAAQREAASAAARLPPSLSPSLPPASSSARRGRLFGRTDPNAALILYAEAWGRKIQLNQTFDMVRDAAKQPHTDPIVTVALRSDGSVESVTFVRSSGVAGIDDAIRRVVNSQLPYQAFPPGLAREYDVIEIRRTWTFDMAIRLY